MDSVKLNQWLTTLANFGVIVGIVFLVLEIRQTSMQIEQNTAAFSAQSIFQLNQSAGVAKRAIAQDAELAELLMRGDEDPESLTELEQARFMSWKKARFDDLEAYWLFHRKGLIDDRDASGMRGSICGTFAVKGSRWVWQNRPGNYTAGFVESVENLCFQ